MRYYSIVLSDPVTGQVQVPNSLRALGAQATYTSYVNGVTLPGAQNVELNVPVTVFDTPVGAAYVRVWGISLEEISQANDLRGKGIKVFAGMQKGLPLAKPAQAGLILQGFVNQAFGNWIGNEQTLDLIVQAGTGTPDTPKNLVHHWPKGTPLADAIRNTLTSAFPGYAVETNISSSLVLTEDDVGYYSSMEEFAEYIQVASKTILGGDYPGVRIVLKETTFQVFDGTTQLNPIQLAFEDMIGQPTWIDQLTVQFKCAMRADISVADYVKFPAAIFTETPSGAIPAGSPLRTRSIFQGVFLVTQMNHFGNFRQPDAASWNTTFNVSPAQVQ